MCVGAEGKRNKKTKQVEVQMINNSMVEKLLPNPRNTLFKPKNQVGLIFNIQKLLLQKELVRTLQKISWKL